jgi:hypothetical protein
VITLSEQRFPCKMPQNQCNHETLSNCRTNFPEIILGPVYYV